MPLLIHSPIMVCGLVLVLLGLIALGLWVFIQSSLWMTTPVKARAIQLDYHVHFLRSAFLLLGVGGVLITVPLWPLAGADHSRIPGPGARQVPLHHDRNERGEERTGVPDQDERAGQTERQGQPDSTAFNIAGEWTILNTVLDTQYATYKNLQLGFRLWIEQQGNTFTGTGEKYLENGRPLPIAARHPITIQGTLKDGAVIEATFHEAGLRRHSSGRFQLTRHDAHHLQGTFSSTAAGTRGSSQWARVE